MKSVVVFALLFSTGCVALKTRQDLREDGETSRQARNEQRPVKEFKEPKAAAAVARTEEIDDQFRNINGRVDTIENQLNKSTRLTKPKNAVSRRWPNTPTPSLAPTKRNCENSKRRLPRSKRKWLH